MEITNFQRDTSTISAGQWVGEIPNMGDVRLRVRGLSSPVVMACRSRKERKVPKQDRDRDGTLKPDVALRIFGEVLFESVLLDWDNITNNGEKVPYDKEAAYVWLTDPDFTPFADAVTWAAGVVDRGQAESEDELAKNSATSSRSSSNGATLPAK